MSWWDRYFAPGDLRARQVPDQPSNEASTAFPTTDTIHAPPVVNRIDGAHRARRQNALMFGGIAFTILSGFVTRRALIKKRIAAYPHLATKSPNTTLKVPHFTQSNTQAKAEGGLDAAEALFLATLNVGSIFMAATGGFMKYFDIADVQDLREFVKSGIGYDVYGGETEADKEIEGWFAEILSRKDGTGNLRETIVEKMAELEKLEKKRKAELQGDNTSKA